MIKKQFLLLIFIMILPASLLAKSNKELSEKESLDKYYQNFFAGEKKTSNYFGALDPRSVFSEETGDLTYLDDIYSNQYINDQIGSDPFVLHDFWFKKVMEKSTCPDVTLGESIDYIRYLYRLLSISYLFESLKINHKTTAALGADKNICSLSFDEVFGKCKPQSDDMKKFHERVYGKFVNEFSKINVTEFNKAEMRNWLDNFQKSTSLTIDPIHARLHDWCHMEKKNCRTLTINDVRAALGTICNDDRNLIQKICSEKDNLFGASYIDKSMELIQTSNAFNLINHTGMGEDCLRRYIKIFSPKEIRYGSLGRQFPLIYSQLIREKSRYLQGELFLPGALKEFDIKGLSDFLVALKPPKVEVAIVIPKSRAKPTPKPVIVAQKKIVEIKPEPVVVPTLEPLKPKISEFEKTVLELEEKKMESLFVNMDRFRDDFEFTPQMIADLAGPIKKFQTRAALSDMKSYDNLGSAEVPVALIFIKYLIDTENHQGLFNIVTVFGDKFFVYNDIENKEKPIYINLRNDSSTNNHWQIIILKNHAKK